MLEAEQLLVVALFEVILLTILGWRLFRALLAPLLFLFFLVPFGAFLVPSLQRFTAAFATKGLSLVGIPVFADGLVIEIPEGTFEIVEACAGLRFLIASVVFGCFFATVVYRSKWRRLLFVFLSILVPILANGMRAFGLILVAHFQGSATAMEADHVIYGWAFFTLVTLLLMGIGFMLADPLDESTEPTAAISGSYRPILRTTGRNHRVCRSGDDHCGPCLAKNCRAGFSCTFPGEIGRPFTREPVGERAR